MHAGGLASQKIHTYKHKSTNKNTFELQRVKNLHESCTNGKLQRETTFGIGGKHLGMVRTQRQNISPLAACSSDTSEASLGIMLSRWVPRLAVAAVLTLS